MFFIVLLCLTDTSLYIYICVKHFGMANINSSPAVNTPVLYRVSIFTSQVSINICAVAFPTECNVVLWLKVLCTWGLRRKGFKLGAPERGRAKETARLACATNLGALGSWSLRCAARMALYRWAGRAGPLRNKPCLVPRNSWEIRVLARLQVFTPTMCLSSTGFILRLV